jgi:hypothetical protein
MSRLNTIFIVLLILGGLLMGSCQKNISTEISKKQIIEIESEIKNTAISHLNSKDAVTALSYYTDDAILVSNGYVYDSFEEFTKMIEGFYDNLSTIDFADYYDMHIDVLLFLLLNFALVLPILQVQRQIYKECGLLYMFVMLTVGK